MNKFKLPLLLGGALLATGCCNDVVDEPTPLIPDNKGEVYEISLSLGGEFVEVSESPMSRADEIPTPKNYYGVNVYCMKTDGTESKYSNYAYGVFDNISDMKITLLEGYRYRFECTTVKELNHYRLLNDDEIRIYEPFTFYYTSSSSSGNGYYKSDLNRFITSSTQNLHMIKNGYTSFHSWYSNYAGYYEINNCSSDFPPFDRFYGELEDYTPTTNGVATIHLNRTAFGLNLVINGVPDGSLSWSNSYLMKYNYNEPNSTNNTEQAVIQNIYTFSEVYNCWKNLDTYTKDFTIDFVWTRANGYQQKFSKTFTAKRNVNTTLTVNLEGGANNVTFGLQEDDTEMGSESERIDYNGGALTDTDVDPTE